ncbi:hypothetical protein [Fuscibacter oryzae]|uniref:D-glycerate dehydrogenase n=1 Tax=Fuscibacter oryzae TaxID=2803939 RepID=A0A8J7MP70_9RHOB|nr:hypothetical protein [Fuscibacter oryzae]MBL4926932.1 hypothetical protein [Fuscibacter oryzae]
MRLLITSRLPDTVLAAASARFDATLRDRTAPLFPDELRGFDLQLPTLVA